MRQDVKQSVGRPENAAFIRRCILYGILLAVMLFAAPGIFGALMTPMAADGMTAAWYAVFIPIAAAMMAIGLFRSWRRRWPLAYMDRYRREAKNNDYETCPRCGSPLVLKKRTRNNREKTGELVTTTTYTDGSKTVDRKDIYENVKRTSYYHECTNNLCRLEAEQHIGQSHLPWKTKQIRCLVLNDNRLLSRKHPYAKSLLLSRLLVPILALVVLAVCAFNIYNYAKLHEGDWTFAVADREASRSAEDYQTYLLSLDTAHRNWHIAYENAPSDMMSYLKESFLGQDGDTEYSLESYRGEDGTVLYYSFEGDDAGTGLPDGDYILMALNGDNVLIDDDNETIYKQGTSFYDTYAPKLRALTHDSLLQTVLARVDGGEHALAEMDMEFLRKEPSTVYSYMNSENVTEISGEFRAVTLHPETCAIEQWFFSYDDSDYTPDAEDFEDYVYGDAASGA